MLSRRPKTRRSVRSETFLPCSGICICFHLHHLAAQDPRGGHRTAGSVLVWARDPNPIQKYIYHRSTMRIIDIALDRRRYRLLRKLPSGRPMGHYRWSRGRARTAWGASRATSVGRGRCRGGALISLGLILFHLNSHELIK